MNAQPPAEMEAVEHVVAIGASAGGLEALEQLFDHLPANTGAAFVVITHLSPDFKSIMDELLARRTAMSVHVVEDGQSLTANNVFVIPPGKDMIVQSGRLFLTDREGHGAPAAPIDLFLGALARAYGRRATAVILSGTGADGARGARALRAGGGYIIAQSLETARFDGMPRAVAEAGVVDAVLAPQAMGGAIIARMARLDAEDTAPAIVSGHSDGVARVLELVLGGSNVDFSEYKKTTILRRIARRMQNRGVSALQDYVADLESDADEVRALSEDLLIVVTEFFRDPPAFALLDEIVAPELLAAAEERPVRIWTPAVGTGQEAYSIAMILREAAQRIGREPRVQIFATDISPGALERAAAGVYTEAEMAAVSAERRKAFFTRTEDGAWQVSPDLRGGIVFAQHNMLRDPPFINTQLISCRNALIYLEASAQNKALSLFHFSLAQSGYLLLGPSESIGEDTGRFDAVDPRWRLFRKRGADRRDAAAMGELIAGSRRPEPPPSRRVVAAGPQPGRGHGAIALQPLLELFAPPGLLVGRERELLHVVGDVQRYLAPPQSGPFTRDAVKLTRPELRAALATAIDRALRTGHPVSFGAGDGEAGARVSAHPLAGPDGQPDKVFVAFGPTPEAPPAAQGAPLERIVEERIAYLEDALRQERENLQAMLEQLETSNEELQSTNEELMTSNEELQSTNEELHSVNEELYTVNAEYERKNEELTQLTKDVSSLLQATGVGVVFVDRDLRVRRFTPTATRVVNLMPGDEGRRLDHITHALRGFDLSGWLEGVMEAGDMVEEEREAADGAVWTVRAAPMRDGRLVTGAVVSLIEVSRLVKAEAEARARGAELRELLDWVGAVSLHFSASGALIGGLDRWRAFTVEAAEPGQETASAPDERWLAAIHPDDRGRVAAAWRDAHAASQRFELSARLRKACGDWRTVTLAGGPTREGAAVIGWYLYLRDAEEAAIAEASRRDAQARAAALAEMAFAGSYAQDPVEGWVEPDDRLSAALGLPRGRMTTEAFEARMTPQSRRARAEALAARGLRGGRWSAEVRFVAEDGAETLMRDVGAPTPGGMLVGAFQPLDEATADAALAEEILRSSPVEVVVLDAETLCVDRANAAALRNLNYEEDALRGRHYASLLPEFDAAEFEAALAPLRDGATGEVRLETFALRRDGSTYDLTLALRPMAGGARIAAVGRDATARRQAEDTLRRRTEALARARRDLEEIALAAGHELIAPLGWLADGVATAARGGADATALAEQAALAARLQGHVRDLMAFARSKTGAGGAGETFRRVDLADAARAAAVACAATIEEAGAAVEIEALPVVRGSPEGLRFALRVMMEKALAGRAPDSRPTLRVCVDAEQGDRIVVEATPAVAPGLDAAMRPSSPVGGWELGGALLRSVLDAHGAGLEEDADFPGRVVVMLPSELF
ncbi:chemotaxis protein CheB [Rubrimonas cliftonensis]|uniref:PAS domain S-box-containing protein n=1 Tax=Rubrimonas cliftonensis TaxID=89524 RepID=A0A1H4F421_9RHOB|nr:chemotaxis protein CheB [Rubrimonas cliftonensis]SEA91690.1 PAS domain S-box-containing protein [Rubrimonas cliftonensis]